MKNKLKEEIDNYIKKTPVRFHVPSHKGRNNQIDDLYSRDITELSFSDNLNDPNAILKDEEQQAAEIFNSNGTIFTVNGATAAIIASIMSVVKPCEKLLLPTNSHISCYYGAIHADAHIIPLKVENFTVGITLEEVLTALDQHKSIGACVITNPTYYGCCNDIESICEELHKHDIAVIVDESHGTHFHFSDIFPLSALDCGADIVVHSGHKTINGLTQTGLLHLNTVNIDVQTVRSKLRLVQSTSPSYILLLSLIDAIHQLKSSADILNTINVWYNSLKSELDKDAFFILRNHNLYLQGNAFNYDPLKLYISAPNQNITGRDLDEILASKYAIYSEMSDDDGVLLVSGLNANQKDYARLLNALKNISIDTNGTKLKQTAFKSSMSHFEYKQILGIRKAYLSQSNEYVKLKDAIGQISADFIIAYPPGVPILIPGSLIETDIIETIIHSEINFSGVHDGYIKIVKR